jgi:hypothetical protein
MTDSTGASADVHQWMQLGSVQFWADLEGLVDFIHVPNEHDRGVVDHVSEYHEILHGRLSSYSYSLRFHRSINAGSDPLIALEGAAKQIEALIYGLFRIDEVRQAGGGNWLHGIELLRREINHLIKLFVA